MTRIYWNVEIAAPVRSGPPLMESGTAATPEPQTFDSGCVSLAAELVERPSMDDDKATVYVFGECREVKRSQLSKSPRFDWTLPAVHMDGMDEVSETLESMGAFDGE